MWKCRVPRGSNKRLFLRTFYSPIFAQTLTERRFQSPTLSHQESLAIKSNPHLLLRVGITTTTSYQTFSVHLPDHPAQFSELQSLPRLHRRLNSPRDKLARERRDLLHPADEGVLCGELSYIFRVSRRSKTPWCNSYFSPDNLKCTYAPRYRSKPPRAARPTSARGWSKISTYVPFFLGFFLSDYKQVEKNLRPVKMAGEGS